MTLVFTPLVPLRRPLTAREQQIVQLVSHGRTNAQIAAQLGVAVPTVKTALTSIAAAAGTGARAGIVGSAFRAGYEL